jgi:predicted ribosomally synthesized peptide with nif11-like leader
MDLREVSMSEDSARKLVKRLKDDETFRKTIGSLDFAEAWQMAENEGYKCSAEEIQKAYDNFGCGITGPRSAWREAVKKLCRLPLRFPGSHVSKDI